MHMGIMRAFFVAVAALVLAGPNPATAAPLAGLPDLVGSWKCTYHAGPVRMAYDATYTYDRDGHALREIASWAGGGDEELLAYDAQHHAWTVIVLDNGAATIMRGNGSNPNHVTYRGAYGNGSIAETFDLASATAYTLHATVLAAGTTTTSVDTCTRGVHA
jgi:hypothetical protein